MIRTVTARIPELREQVIKSLQQNLINLTPAKDLEGKAKFYMAKKVGRNWSILGYHTEPKDSSEIKSLVVDGKKLRDLKKEFSSNFLAIPFGYNLEAPGFFYQIIMECASPQESETLFQKIKGKFGRKFFYCTLARRDF